MGVHFLDITKNMKQIVEKVKNHSDKDSILKRIERILECIDYEIDKFRDTRASVIFTGNLHPNTLFTLASMSDYKDLQNGINNVINEINYLNSKYNINFQNDVKEIFYQKLNVVIAGFLKNVDFLYSPTLKDLIVNRENFSEETLINIMQNLLDKFDEIDNEDIKKLLKLLLTIDPLYSNLNSFKNYQEFTYNNFVNKELNFNFLDNIVRFFNKIYNQTFGNKDKVDAEKSSNRP